MRICKSLNRVKKNRQDERIRNLEKELECLYEDVRELHQRVTQLEIIRKLGN